MTASHGTGRRPDVLAVIPARSGSKGLPHKNVLDLGGIPLMAWSIRTALACPLVTRVVVSTEDDGIAAIAREYGAEVPFARPRELAGDRSLAIHAVQHVLDRLGADEGYTPQAYCTLYPTHPFRPPLLVTQAVELALEAHSPVVAARALCTRNRPYLMPEDGGWTPLRLDGATWRPYGLVEAKSLLRPLRGVRLLPVDDPVALVDIDTEADLRLAREVVGAGLAAVPGGAP